MKTNYTLLLAGLLSVSSLANAQTAITLNAAGYTLPPGVDTTHDPISYAPFATLGTPATNASWNFSQVAYDTNIYYLNDRTPPPNPNPFPGSTFSTYRIFEFGGGLSYGIEKYNTLTTASLAVPGETIITRQALPLGSATGNPNDSLIFPVQTVPYNVPEKALVFPATYLSTWNSVIKSNTAFNLTVTGIVPNNTPGERRSERTRTDSVVGWGDAVIKIPNGAGPSVPVPVLQVRSKLLVRDSFFLNGQPAPPTLLAAFGLEQGQVDTTSRIYLYRTGETTPLVEAIWYTGTPVGEPDDVRVHTQRLNPLNIGVENLPSTSDFILSPNPVRRGQALHFTPENGTWKATVLNTMGQVVAAQTIVSAGAAQTLELPGSLPAGTYFLHLQMGEKALPAQSFVLVD